MKTWRVLVYETWHKTLIWAALLCTCIGVFAPIAQGGTISRYSDTISDSRPTEGADHTVQFFTDTAIPPSGFIRFSLDSGNFEIPATNFDIDNIELYVSSTPSGFTQRLASSTADAVYDGVTITPGTSGNIEVTLNSTTGIPAGSDIRLLLGKHTTYATTTDNRILNAVATGTFDYIVEIGDGGSSELVTGKIALLEGVGTGDIDTRETVPPVRFNGAPSGTISGTTLIVEMSLETDEFAVCRYDTASGTSFYSMGNVFSTSFETVHGANITVATNTSYTYYVRCVDDEGNLNTDDYEITFTVPAYPEGEPGPSGETEGEGEGSGEGSGSSEEGQGDPTGDDNSSGGSSGGGSGGGGGGGSGSSSGGNDGGGGFESSGGAYQSGDGRVIITGYAFPNSTVVALVDGTAAESVRAGNDGSFEILIDAIARGVYTFGVYATDRNSVRSSTFSTTFTITGSRVSTLSNINVTPSIKVTPDPVTPGETVTLSGFSIPNANITIENQSEKSSASLKSFTTTSNSSGAWSYQISTDGFNTGTYKVRAKAEQTGGESTGFSGYTYYGVGQAAAVPRSSDLNRDGKVNLTDFSILLFWWNTNGGNSNPPADINGDGKVSLTDFSIMIFNWTG